MNFNIDIIYNAPRDGKVSAVIVDIYLSEHGRQLMRLEGAFAAGWAITFRDECMFVAPSAREQPEVFRCVAHDCCIGEFHWEQLAMEAADAARLINWLRRLRGWSCTEGPTRLHRKWQRVNEPFTADDLERSANALR